MKQRKRKGKYLNRILACLGMMLILVNCFAGIVRADSYEQGKKGSFDLTIQEQNSEGTGSAPIAGVKLKLYKVGSVSFDGNVHFIINSELSSSGVDFEKLKSASDWYSAAEKLVSAVSATSQNVTEKVSDLQGKITYADLEEGMYLIVGDANSTATVTPMLLSVPFATDEGWVYNVQAYPKAEINKFSTGITVTKRLYYIDMSNFGQIPMNASDATFKIGLFLDKEGTIPFGSDYIKSINIKKANSGTATYNNVPDGTYYIFELDENNKPMEINKAMEVSSGKSYYYTVTDKSETENNSALVDQSSPQAVSYVNNNYYYLPDGYYLSGRISITKRVLVDGQETTTDDTFYAGVFSNKNGSMKLVQNVELKQNDTVTVTIPFEENQMPDSVTYVVKETDKDGNILNADDFPYQISGEGDVKLEESKQYRGSITITNSKNKNATATPTAEPGGSGDNGNGNGGNPARTDNSGSTSQKPVKTGDNSNPAFWGLLLIGSALLIGVFVYRTKKQK